MAVNKNALVRYQALDKCFRNSGRMYFWEDLLEECNQALLELGSDGIQRRQLFEDIKFMESDQGWSIPLDRIKFGRKTYYRYSDKNFSINNQPVNHSEAEQIRAALQIFSRFTGTPQFEWLNATIPILESKFGLVERKNEVISYDSNIDLKGLEFITPLFNAIINERVLSVKYQDFKSEKPYDIVFHPYYLKQYNNRWFIFGLNAANKNPHWNLALDRIEKISETDLKYLTSETDWEEYFYDIVGVTKPRNEDPLEIILEFSKDVAPYVITKPLHPTQKHNWINDRLVIRIQVIPNLELEMQILGFSELVKIISPIDFKDKVINRLKRAANQ